jgi:cytidylate kinase
VHASDVRVRLQHLQRESVSGDAQVVEGRKILTGLMLQHINGFEVATYERVFLL